MKLIALAIVAVALLFAGTLTLPRLINRNSEAAALPMQSLNLEYDTNRPGSDYRDFEIQADPARCRDACANDSTCRAFTYVKPGIQGQNAHCWLKSAVPNSSANNCCVSGVKSGGNSAGGLEVDVNRLGGDYRDFELRSNNPYDCREACANDSRCASFTYVRPSFFGQYSHCFLKSSVPDGRREGCCISGVIRAGGGGRGGNSGGGGVAIGWDESLVDKGHRGENGKRFTYNCPANGRTNAIWGWDIYTDDSKICVAAVHAGLISFAGGGTVTVEVRPGEQHYNGGTRNGVESREYGGFAGSYVFVR